jgi:hypothetical protein
VRRRESELREQIRDCGNRLNRYRRVIDQDGDLASVARWIDEDERKRKSLNLQLGREAANRLTKEQVQVLAASLSDVTAVLAGADGDDKAALYRQLGIGLTYHKEGRVTAGGSLAWSTSACRRNQLDRTPTPALHAILDIA